MAMISQRLALTLLVYSAAPVAAVGEDFFALLGAESGAKADSAATTSPDEAPVGNSIYREPTASLAEVSDGLIPAQALELIPAPQPSVANPLEGDDLADSFAPALNAQQKSSISTTLGRPILSLTLDAGADPELLQQNAKIPDGFAIKDLALDRFGAWEAPQSEVTLAPSRFAPNGFHFAAPAVYTRPLYFEQPNLERYGHHIGFCQHDNLSQSAVSAAHFFATAAVLPYKMGAQGPGECSYVLGAYRPGSCNPHQLLRPELSLRGAALEGAAVTGLIFLIP